MDESSRLIAELHLKLRQLDDKVAAYRHDMTLEYTKYAEGLLDNVADDVSVQVKNNIAESMARYPYLVPQPPGCLQPGKADSALTGSSLNTSNTSKPGPIISIVPSPAFGVSDGPRSPHARDAEFTGLFTPSYLPLLDSSDRNERYFSADTSPALIPAAVPVFIERSTEPAIAPTTMSSSYDGVSSLPKPPTPRRRNTDEVSIRSDTSDGPKRRSALRRTSSSTKAQSPRRVRFEFEGQEFMTTSSPNPPAPIGEMAATTVSEEESSLLDSDDEAGSAFVEDINDAAPPKRISSSQALRNLSRGPVEDDGTQWIAMVSPPDGSASVERSADDSEGEEEEGFFDFRSKKNTDMPMNDHGTASDLAAEEKDVLPEMSPLQSARKGRLSTPISTSKIASTSMPAKSVSLASSTTPHLPEASASTTALSPSKTDPDVLEDVNNSDEDDDFFGFEANSSRVRGKYIEHESSDEETVELEDEEDPLHTNPSTYSETPGREITPRESTPIDPMGSVPNFATGGPQIAGEEKVKLDASHPSSPILPTQRSNPNTLFSSSYNILPPPLVPVSSVSRAPFDEPQSPTQTDADRAQHRRITPTHPFSTPVIDPALHTKLSKIRGGSSFVGSVSGKSGVDESNAEEHDDDTRIKEMAKSIGDGGVFGSFRESRLSGSLAGGGPRSLSERMRLEEYMEGRSGGR